MKSILPVIICFIAACGGAGAGADGSGLCQRYDDVHLSDKMGKCELRLVGLPTRSACDSGLSSCNKDDQRQLGTLLDCLGQVSNCQPGEEDSWANQVNSCFDRLDLSSSCNFE
jgi:hypothetical protein